MIYSLKDIFIKNNSESVKHFVKDQMIHMYTKENSINHISLSTFSNIILENNFYIKIDQTFNVYGIINYYIKKNLIGKDECYIEQIITKNEEIKKELLEFCIQDIKKKCNQVILMSKIENIELYKKFDFQQENIGLIKYF